MSWANKVSFDGQVISLKIAGDQSNLQGLPEITLRIDPADLQTSYGGLIHLVEDNPAAVNALLTELLTASTVHVTIEICQP